MRHEWPDSRRHHHARRKDRLGIFNLDPLRHGLVRRIRQPYFSPASAHELRGTITSYAHQLIDSLEAGPNPADLMSAFAVPLALIMACEVMAVPVEQRRAIMPETRAQMDWRQSSALIGASTQRLMAFADDVIAAKRAEGQDGQDPVSALIRAQNAGDIDTDELRGTVMYLFLTSAEPVTGPTAVGVYSLLRHPEILSRLRATASDDLWEQAIRELLRFHHNSATSLPRRALTDLDISGVRISQGDLVITPWLAATWDPKHYKNPEKLRLGRATGNARTSRSAAAPTSASARTSPSPTSTAPCAPSGNDSPTWPSPYGTSTSHGNHPSSSSPAP
ncbi:cytochrome P450 [Streptomyces sp. NPDC002221]|uniref:cytochrome P450 n=1 Tax=Streptomyces sp. NPDC002221 TaxID=3364639 RepID=UPI0036B151A7